jgi:hypothetical protein
MLRGLIVIIFTVMFLMDDTSYARSTTNSSGRSNHKYYSGVIQSSSNEGIVVNDRNFLYSANVKIKAHEKRDNGFREVAGNMNEVRSGAHVVLKIEGSNIYEIIIERWKQ